MTKPTARELLHDILSPSADGPWVSSAGELASRVEKVLALSKKSPPAKLKPIQIRAGWAHAMLAVERLLNGEEP
jgi:hypothetical protein